jgi:DNA-binding LacI/PurR family transcriptional regulator
MTSQQQPKPQAKRATLTRIATELGVSAKTVSNAYRHPDQLSPTLRDRILETADRLGFAGPDPLASSLRRGSAAAIGFIYDNPLSYAFNDEAAVELLAGISEVAEAEGISLMLVPGTAAGERDPAGIAGAAIDGVIAYSIASDDPVLDYTRRRGVPLVIIDQPSIAGVPHVGIDDDGAAFAAAAHVRDLGHRRIAAISFALERRADPRIWSLAQWPGTSYAVTGRRLSGYARALRGHVPLDQVPLVTSRGSNERLGHDATTQVLARPLRPTALLCLSDSLALGALTAAQDLGLRVPDDISIVGFDDIPSGRSSTPPLTTISQSHREKGRTAASMLFAMLRGERIEPARTLPTELVIRDSTGAPRGSSRTGTRS